MDTQSTVSYGFGNNTNDSNATNTTLAPVTLAAKRTKISLETAIEIGNIQ